MASCKTVVCLGRENICKNCIKEDVCKIAEDFYKNPVYGMYIEDCDYFKDRNRFMEFPSTSLPIKIFLADNINGSFALRDYYFDSRNQKLMMTIYSFDAHKYFSRELTDFCKTVFLTKSEAERALKERNRNDKL